MGWDHPESSDPKLNQLKSFLNFIMKKFHPNHFIILHSMLETFSIL